MEPEEDSLRRKYTAPKNIKLFNDYLYQATKNLLLLVVPEIRPQTKQGGEPAVYSLAAASNSRPNYWLEDLDEHLLPNAGFTGAMLFSEPGSRNRRQRT